jgi:hypothetical protein
MEVIRRRLHGFRHFNAVLSLRRGIGVFDVARNTASAIAGFPAGLNGNKVKTVTRSLSPFDYYSITRTSLAATS